MNIHNNFRMLRVAPDATAATTYTLSAGTTDVNSASIDTRGFGHATILLALGALVSTATLTVKVQGSANGSTGWTDIAGATATFADTDDNKVQTYCVGKPAFRFLRLVIDRGTANSTIDGIVAFLGSPQVAGVTHDTATVMTPVAVSN